MRKLGLTVVLVLCAYTIAFSQLNYANRLYEEKEYEAAARLYEKVLEKDSTELVAIERLAGSYKKINKYDLAEKYYAKAVKYQNAESESFLNYGQLLKNNNKISQAREQFKIYLDRNPESLMGKILLQSCDAIKDWTASPAEFQLTNLDEINTEFLEIGAFPFGNKLVFTSDKNYLKKNEDDAKAKKSLDGMAYAIYLYDSTLTSDKIVSFSGNINTIENIEGPAYFNKSQDKLLYTKVFSRQRFVVNQMEIHTAHLKDSQWVKSDPFEYNNKDYSVANPVISHDERFLYFASDKPGGIGGFDIYVCEKTETGYSKPVNLSSIINTPGHEIPSYIDENDNLYFSSSFHPGFGGLDIFKTNKKGTWTTPENLKVPFNSSKDDLGYIMVDSLSGYFSSNRDGGHGQDDIYFFIKRSFADTVFYTDVHGLFMLDTLPIMNVSLALLDENDEIIQMITTNEKGEFVFNNVPSNKQFKILINEDPSKIPDEAKIYLTDERYQKIMLIERLKQGLFQFETLARDDYNGLSLMEEQDDAGLPTLVVLGQLVNPVEGAIISNKKVYVVDDEGKVIASSLSDHLGKFQFEKLSIDDEYLFKLAEDDPNIEIHIINQKGKVIGQTLKNSNGIYVYHKFTINPSDQPDIRGVFKFGNLPADGVTLTLVNEFDEVLQITSTNVKGEFEFRNLTAGTSYKIKVDSSIKVPGNSNMFIMDKYTGLYLPVSKLNNGEFQFETLSRIDPEEIALMDEVDFIVKPRHDLKGRLESKNQVKSIDGKIIHIQDVNGNVIAKSKTDQFGMFKFFNLPAEESYLFGLPEDDTSYSINVLNDENAVIGIAQKNIKNQYVYHKFTINPSAKPDVRGLFKFGELPASDITLNLMDESDHIIQVTNTNNKGEFAFKKLKSGRAYRIEVDSSEGEMPENSTMYILDEYTGLMIPVSKLKNGLFKFETLGAMEAEEIALMEEIDDNPIRFSFFSQLFSKLPMDLGEGLEIFVLDDKGNIIAVARSDRFGKYNFENLPYQDEYMLKITEDDPNYEMKVITKDGETLGVLKRNEKGEFVFNRKELSTTTFAGNAKKEQAVEKAPDAIKNKETKSPVWDGQSTSINFEFARWNLKPGEKEKLHLVINALKENQNFKLEINSFTDSRGDADYNIWLSSQRSKSISDFVAAQGVLSNRIISKNLGESELLNECADGVPCSKEQHAINRRTQLKILK